MGNQPWYMDHPVGELNMGGTDEEGCPSYDPPETPEPAPDGDGPH